MENQLVGGGMTSRVEYPESEGNPISEPSLRPSKPRLRQEKGTVELIEEAVHLLRLSPVSILTPYYLGSLPFILGFLYFWADMSRGVSNDGYCAVAALGLAVLFIWMKCWQAVFASQLRNRVSGKISSRRTLRQILRLITTQTIIHPWGLPLLPLAILTAFPFAWIYAFFQNVSILGDGEIDEVKTVFKKSWHQAKLWPMQNHILLSILSFFGIFVFLNVAVAILFLPYLLKMLLGVETLFTQSIRSLLNTTFLATSCAVTYLCIDPLIKTVYVLRCFYGDSLRSGADLRMELKSLLHPERLIAILFVLGLAFQGMISPKVAVADMNPISLQLTQEPQSSSLDTTTGEERRFSPEELDRSIREVLDRREYSWRMPREKVAREEDHEKGLLAAFIEAITDTLQRWFKTVLKWMKQFGVWMDDFLKKLITPEIRKKPSGTDWTSILKGLVSLLSAVLIGILTILFRRMWQRRRRHRIETAGDTFSTTPDLGDEQVTADELPMDRWLMLAQEMTRKGELRLALRALYLACLAYLNEHQLITLAGFKSNREYAMELNRRAHEYPDLFAAFVRNVTLFDRTWYGMHPVTRQDMDEFTANQERIRICIENE